jgi:hypothetical protein
MNEPKKRPAGQKKKIDGLLLGVSETAQLLGMPDRALRGRISRREVPYRKLGHGENARVVFLRSELEEFLATLPGVSLSEIRRREAEKQ